MKSASVRVQKKTYCATAERARQAKRAKRHPLQDLWDRNGAAIYTANQKFKEKHGRNMNARERRKAIKNATVNGVFYAGAYAANLEVAEKERRARAAKVNAMPMLQGSDEWPSEADKPWVQNPPWPMRTVSPTPTATQTPYPWQTYKTIGTLTPWEATTGGQVAHNAHLLLGQSTNYYFWSDDDPGGNSSPPLPPGYDLSFPISTNISPEISEYTNGRIPFVCGDVPDLAYYMAGYNLQQSIPLDVYPNRWPRSSYGYLTMLYQQNNYHIYSTENNGSFDVLPELGDVIITQTDNNPLTTFDPETGESPAGHVVVVAEVHGNTPEQVVIIEGNPDDGTLAKHTVQELIDRVPDLQYLIYGHPDLPVGTP